MRRDANARLAAVKATAMEVKTDVLQLAVLMIHAPTRRSATNAVAKASQRYEPGMKDSRMTLSDGKLWHLSAFGDLHRKKSRLPMAVVHGKDFLEMRPLHLQHMCPLDTPFVAVEYDTSLEAFCSSIVFKKFWRTSE